MILLETKCFPGSVCSLPESVSTVSHFKAFKSKQSLAWPVDRQCRLKACLKISHGRALHIRTSLTKARIFMFSVSGCYRCAHPFLRHAFAAALDVASWDRALGLLAAARGGGLQPDLTTNNSALLWLVLHCDAQQKAANLRSRF